MKKFKSLFYAVALALIFVCTASVTKVSASSAATYKLTWNVPANCSVKVYVSETEVTSGTSVGEGTEISITCTAPSGFVIEVTSDDVELTKFGQGYGFNMPAKNVNLTISMGPESNIPTSGTISENNIKVEYDKERIEVSCGKQVYYQVVKSEAPGKLKTANWIKAAMSNNKYYIDFSSVANGKDAYFALTTDNAAESAEKVAVVDSVIKSVKLGLNYRTEVITNGLADVISTLNVKGVDGGDDNDKGTAAEYSLKWKRGANGKWTEAEAFDQLQWDMLKASNGTLYVAIDGKVKAAEEGKEVEVTLFRLSKEAKVKIPKSAKAPTVKIDYAKDTIALKNGMQVSIDGKKWMTVSPYDKNETTREHKFYSDSTTVTKTKVSAVTPRELVDAVNTNNLDSCQYGSNVDIVLLVRTAATDKKFPSASTTITFKTPAARPEYTTAAANGQYPFSYTVADKTAGITAEMTMDVSKLIDKGKEEDFSKFEYILLDNAVGATEVDLLKVKWSPVPADGKVDLSGKIGKTYKYTKTDKSSATVKYEDSTFVVLRRKADKENELFASGYREIGIQFIEAKFVDIKVTAQNATYKVVVGENEATKAKAGDKVTVTYTVGEGYKLSDTGVVVTGYDGEVTKTDGKVEFTVKGDAEVTVTINTEADTPAAGGDA